MTTSTGIRDARFPGASLMDEEEREAVARVMRSGSLFRYYGIEEPEEVAAYEREWAVHVGVEHALAVNSGTSALFCALVAAGVGRGSEVILPAFGWVSGPNAILQLGAVPVVVDVDDSLTLDPAAVERALGPRTAAILPVHMRGAASAIGYLSEIAAEVGVALVEDACQAAGATYAGRPAGSFGLTSAVSTQYAKVVSTGEGGMVLTNDTTAYHAALDAHDPANAIRRGEQPSSYPGLNFRCTELQAAVGRVQLRRLPSLVERTRAHAARIEAAAEAEGLTLRRRHESASGNGIAVIFFAETPHEARRIQRELRGLAVPSSCLYEPGTVDLHVSACWRTVHTALAEQGRAGPDCRSSFELLSRAVQIDVHPRYEREDVDAICEALASVCVR